MEMNDRTPENPFAAPAKREAGALADVAGQREVAEVQGAMVLARRFPRDQKEAMDRILTACTRTGLAEQALYSYARGGTDITGPSIRIAEAIAMNWGNIQFGVRELEQRGSESTVEAFAWDLETNVRQVKVFQVPHERHTKSGVKKLTDPRDVYELIANQGARRLRACILGVIPGDVIENAVKQCEVTLHTKADVTPERIKGLLAKFGEIGVTKEMIEKRIQRRMEAITPALIVNLGKVYNSLRDGMSQPGDWFETTKQDVAGRFEDKGAPKKTAKSGPAPGEIVTVDGEEVVTPTGKMVPCPNKDGRDVDTSVCQAACPDLLGCPAHE